MGDAVLRFQGSPAWKDCRHVLLIWGDIPFIQQTTVAAVVNSHLDHGNDFTFATRHVESAYTLVARDTLGEVTGLLETRELGVREPRPGERDIGLFVFRRDAVFPLLEEDLPSKRGASTGEHGFLYLVEHLVRRHFRVEALPIATDLDLVSLNSLKDVHDFL
jgi:bifunctional N-acetylglucosamine-1-phosphate-uridyltransferase/glucosamine-1-phosphate-acetyltransferase GlmU-like protein